MGFPEHFQLHQDDIVNYKHLGNALAPPTAMIWIARALQAIGAPSSQFASAFTKMLFDAIPTAFPNPLTNLPHILPNALNFHTLPLISQRTGLHEEMVSLALSAEHTTAFIIGQDHPSATPLRPQYLLKLLSEAKLTHRSAARAHTTASSLASAIKGPHLPTTATAIAIDLLAHDILDDSSTLTANLAQLIDDDQLALQPTQHTTIITQRYPALSTYLADHYWSTINTIPLTHALVSAGLANSLFAITASSASLRYFAATTNTASMRAFVAIPPGPSHFKRRLIATTSLNELLQRSLLLAAIADIYLFAIPTAPPHDITAYALTRDHLVHIFSNHSAIFSTPSGLQRHL